MSVCEPNSIGMSKVIDAVDECAKLWTVENLSQSVVTYIPHIPLKFFIFSWETTTIQNAFNHNTSYPKKIIALHNVEKI